jgi:ABC-type transport system substrate-binding protein
VSRKNTLVLLTFLLFVFMSVVPLLSTAQDSNVDVYGRPLPPDAAPYQDQVWEELCDSTAKQAAFMAATTVYQRICQPGASDVFSDSLVNLDTNLNLIPAAAESWSVSSDGLTWTFKLRPGQVWSDGTPLTANDWVATYRWMADPKNGYDFTWVWDGVIKNWHESVAGTVSPDQIGMTAVDDNTLAITTAGPAPYLPTTMFFWPPLQAAALTKYGPNYQLDPKTSVSSGPFILKEYVPGDHVTLDANPTYTGFRKPVLRELRMVYGDKLNGSFLAFQNHTVDRVNYADLSAADYAVIKSDPVLLSHYLQNPGDFRTDYLLMDTFNPPFNNQKVRLAFAKALDRESIVSKVINASFNLAIPAYSFLMPGFPASDINGDLKSIQQYDCPAAQQLLSDAGYPGGKGFPDQELELRGESDFTAQRFIAAAASISDCLGIKITTNNMESSAYMNGLLAHPTTIHFGAISYGMDYLDPANVFVGDPAERIKMYQDAQKILVSDVGGIFLDHRIQGDLFQPYIAGGDCFKPNAQGVSGWEWGNDWCWGTIYVTKDVSNFQTFRNQ